MNMIDSTSSPVMTAGRLFNAYVQEARAECLRYLRTPSFLLPTLLFSPVFYIMFGIVLAKANGPEATRYLLASYGTFGVMAPGLFGFGVSLALERDSGLLTLKRAMPMPPGAYLVGKMCMALLVAAIVSTILLVLAIFVAGADMTPTRVATFYLVEILGALPFCGLGLLLSTLVKGQGAPGAVNLVYLPMAFLSGLWFPLSVMPGFIQAIAPIWPAYHLDQLALSAVGLGQGGVALHALVLVGFTAVFLTLAARRLRRHG
ncbi:MAG: putative multidrug ABC transporter permease YbhR [Luteibacter sp.]|uniref:ABC transporter permease n=1 Tax=Luteibacter sp. TaxID=1886636 RepID=UPI0013820175|nr:ABC transporter permease [Luteibacter sp.]KAF1004332.1 MAG: putative multidrug ABC transporter permease YbhR [Luteibacter sp.]